jgi:hypothetical protein
MEIFVGKKHLCSVETEPEFCLRDMIGDKSDIRGLMKFIVSSMAQTFPEMHFWGIDIENLIDLLNICN